MRKDKAQLPRTELSFSLLLIPISLFAISTIIAPNYFFEPVSLPKFFLLGIVASIALSILLIGRFRNIQFISKDISIVMILWIVWSFLSVLFSNSNFTQQIYGVFGRNNGFLTRVFLVILFFYCASIDQSRRYVDSFKALYIGTGAFLAIYGWLQYFDLDPIKWNRNFEDISATLGNSNHFSTLLSIALIYPVVALFKKERLYSPLFFPILIAIEMPILFLIGNFQGVLYAAIIFFLSFLFSGMQKKIKRLVLLISCFAFIGVILLNHLQNGSLARLTFLQESVFYRLDYFRAAIRIGSQNPIFGGGLDSFADWYLRGRDQEAVSRRTGITVDSAHNFVLNEFANGGFALGILASLILILTFFRIGRLIKHSLVDSVFLISVVISICVFTLAILINPINIAVYAWGWSLIGIIFNYKLRTITRAEPSHFGTSLPVNSKTQTSSYFSFMIILIIFTTVFLIMRPEVNSDKKLLAGISSGSKDTLASSAYSGNYSLIRSLLVARIFLDNNLRGDALAILADSVEKNPDCYDCWVLLSGNGDPAQVALAKKNLERLSPLGQK